MAARARLLLISSPLLYRSPPDPRQLVGGNVRTIGHRRRRSTRLVSTMSSNNSPPPATVTITLPGGNPVEIVAAPGVSDSDLRNAINSALFNQWLKNMQSETGLLTCGQMCLRQVHIQGIDMFGRGIGFLKFKADIFDTETKTKIPGIVFARGPAVAVLIILESVGEDYVVLTEQVRVPVGKYILELPAGMIDDERGDVVGTAVREVEEETGISLNAEDMVNLTAFLDPSTECKVYPSPGLNRHESKVNRCGSKANQHGSRRGSLCSPREKQSVVNESKVYDRLFFTYPALQAKNDRS